MSEVRGTNRKPVDLNMFHFLLLKFYHRWRAFLRKQKHHSLQKLYSQAKHRWLPRPKGSICAPTLYGFKIIIRPDHDKIISRSLYYNGTYEAGTIHVLSKCLSSGDIYLDIGSNLGLMALYASKCVGSTGSVLAFEPEPDTFEFLKSNIELSRFTNIKPLNIALGQSKGTATIYNSETNPGAASLIASKVLSGRKSTVQIEKLDDFVQEKKIAAIRMMKIDVEGWELEVLKGSEEVLRSKHAPILCIECSQSHPMQGGTTKDIFDFVSDINQYQIFRLVRGKERVSKLVRIKNADELPNHDNIFCFTPYQREFINERLFENP